MIDQKGTDQTGMDPAGADQVGADTIEATVKAILADVLGLEPARVAAFNADTLLFGALPELDSIAVAGLLTEIEDRLHIVIDDDEVEGEMLESLGALVAFAQGKLAG